MKKIFLSNGKVTLVSDEDLIFLAGYTWHQHKKGYVTGWIGGINKRMHRIIAKRMGLDLTNQIDHKDRNKLNNQRNNLRSATNGQNRANSQSNNQSGFKGVHCNGNHWKAQIKINKQQIHLGIYDSPEEAHDAYCKAAVKYFGEFACFN